MESNLAENGARHPRRGLVTLPLNQIIEFARARERYTSSKRIVLIRKIERMDIDLSDLGAIVIAVEL